jgi:hypothetical protein
MRSTIVLLAVLAVLGIAAGAQGAEKKAAREVGRLASEVQNKIVSKTDSDISVQARGCWLHIEFASNNVTFDLPLLGTRMDETDLEDGIVLQNTHMIRTVSTREPESFEKLILKFGRYNSRPVMDAFESAIKACGGGPAASAGTAARRS